MFDEKCISFSVKVIQLKKKLNRDFKEYNISDQLQRSGSAVGALYREACFAESDLDFIHKLRIGLKECSESQYWLENLVRTDYIAKEEYEELMRMAKDLEKILISMVMKVKQRLDKNKQITKGIKC